MKLPIYQLDAFADRVFAGNPAAVCPLEKWLSDEQMQNIAMENNLAETAFFVPEDERFRIRWFTPATEVDLCGHATLATARVIFDELGWERPEIVFQSRSGMLRVFRDEFLLFLDFPADTLTRVDGTPIELKEAINVDFVDLYRGKTDYLLVVEKQEDVLQIRPKFDILERLDGRGIIVTAPGHKIDFVSRCFYPAVGINEDPVTGSAHTSLTPYWSTQLGKTILHARQLSKRGGELICMMAGDRVEIGGRAIMYMKGEIEV